MELRFLTRINFMRSAKYWIALSVILSIVGIAAALIVKPNYGIDFKGGSFLDVRFEQATTSAAVEQAVSKVVGGDFQVQEAQVKGDDTTKASEFFVRTPELTAEKRDALLKGLDEVGKHTVISEDAVSATVSGELTQRAALAVLAAAALQIIYLWFRFELKFGVTAVVALLHDLIITIGMVSVFRIQVNSAFVAVILTILGYSINDTVIVFDRIRENLKHRLKGETLAELTNRSVQEVITRSVFTVFTVQLTILALLFFGGDTIWEFAIQLFIGITSGMYSSIFIATALWLAWQQWDDNRKKAAVKTKPARA